MDNFKVVYDDEFKVNSTNSLNLFNNQFIEYTKKGLKIYKKLFQVDHLEKLNFVLYDNLEEYRNDYRKALKKEPPEYSRGCFNGNNGYMVIEVPIIPGTEYFSQKRAGGAHEAFHIYYRNLVYKNPENRIVWFDEGMAQFFSGQRDYMNEEQFAKYYSSFKKDYKKIDNLNERIQGNLDITDNRIFARKGIIDGYTISYLAIKYLHDTKGVDFIKDVLRDKEKILELGSNIINKMIDYFDKKIQEKEEIR